MDHEIFLRCWYAESLKRAPLREGESHSYENFVNSPIVQAALFTLKMNSPLFALDLTMLEENLLSCLELKSLPAIPRNVIQQAVEKVRQMKKATI
jgi:hypothetical protein